MPRAPILRRDLFFERLRDGTCRLWDFALVNTSLGAMIEPRPFTRIEAKTNVDARDVSFNSITELSREDAIRLMSMGTNCVPISYAQ